MVKPVSPGGVLLRIFGFPFAMQYLWPSEGFWVMDLLCVPMNTFQPCFLGLQKLCIGFCWGRSFFAFSAIFVNILFNSYKRYLLCINLKWAFYDNILISTYDYFLMTRSMENCQERWSRNICSIKMFRDPILESELVLSFLLNIGRDGSSKSEACKSSNVLKIYRLFSCLPITAKNCSIIGRLKQGL